MILSVVLVDSDQQEVNNMEVQRRVDALISSVLITVQTKGRIDRSKQNTINMIPDYLRKHVIVFTDPSEVDELRSILPDVGDVIGVEHNSIGELRHKILEASHCDTIILDDSLNFHTREPSQIGEETKHPLKGISLKHFDEEKHGLLMLEMFEWMAENIKFYGMVGLSNRPTNWSLEEPLVENMRIWGVWGVNHTAFHSLEDVKMSGRNVKEDMYLQLKFLTVGIPTCSSVRFAFDRKGGINSEGGVSQYRTLDVLHQQADFMVSEFPNYVKKVMKSAKSMNGFEGEVPDIRVQWSKAYKENV